MPSTVVKRRRYDAMTRTLVITFPSGDDYAYANVEPAAWAAMNRALSKGQFFGEFIRPYYAYGKVQDPGAVVFHPPERDIALRPPLPGTDVTRAGRNDDSASPPPAGGGR
jgi:hypothetical protein